MMILGTVLISYLMSIYSPQSKEAYNNNHVNISQSHGLTGAHLCCFSPNLSGGLSRVSDIAGVEYLTTLHSSIWLLFPLTFDVVILSGSLIQAPSVVVQDFKRNEAVAQTQKS